MKVIKFKNSDNIQNKFYTSNPMINYSIIPAIFDRKEAKDKDSDSNDFSPKRVEVDE